jgi:hypothetical protein
MSESKFTPGQWDCHFTPGPWDYHFTEINPYHAYIHGDDKECIALMDSRGGLAKTDEIKANASLIAAAPDLLAAIEELVTLKDTKPHDYEERKAQAWRAAREAIKKARGKE